MQASPMKLLGLLEDNKTVFKVPVYQRKYEWEKEHLDQFFLDITNILKSNYSKEHFLGTVVYVQNDKPGLMKERLLIDGQQRLTTTSILLKAIKDKIKETNESSRKWMEIRDTYLTNPYGSGDTKYKLMPVDLDKDAYYDLMNNCKSNSRIYENYLYCLDFIDKSEYGVEEIYDALGFLNIVYISLDSNENPQVIFESLNSTGLSLTQADLIRNFILMGLDYDSQTFLYKNYWRKIEEKLTNKVISDFIRDYLTMKEGIVAKQSKVYEAFKIYFYNNKYSSEEIASELLIYSQYYREILDAKTNIEELDRQIRYINDIKSSVTYPFLLKLLDDYKYNIVSKREIIEVLEIIVSYLYRRSICGIPTNALGKIFSGMSSEVEERINKGEGYVDAVTDYLMSRTGTGVFPRNEEFKKSFLETDMYSKNNRLSKIILHTIEAKNHKEVVDIDQLTVEHILPQTLTNEWNIELGKKAHEVHALYRNTIGNLTLTNYNSEMANKSFDDKKIYYSKSNINLTRDLIHYKNWTEKEILDRGDKLFIYIKEIWPLPYDRYKSIGEERLLSNQEYSINDNIVVTGYSPKKLIIDKNKIDIGSWRDMLTESCDYLYRKDDELFFSLKYKSIYKTFLSTEDSGLRRSHKVAEDLFVETNYSAKDIVSYVSLLFEEYGMEDQVYFELK